MPTIQDVARKAGVSPITVSRVISQRGYASAAARQKVQAAIDELGYVPNRVASSLRSKRTTLLALVITDITNPYFTMIARGVEDVASAAGYTVLFCNTDESQAKEERYINILLQNQVAGVLLVPASPDPRSVNLLIHKGTPVVVLDRRLDEMLVDQVRSDSFSGAYQLARLLLDLGHCRIALLNGPAYVSTAQDREAGYQRALDEAGIPPDERRVYNGHFSQDSGYEMTRLALADDPPPTALFATNNFIAIGAIHALQAAGLRVSADIALVGFDDLPPAMITFPFLTVSAQPAYEMGRTAAELLLARLNGTSTGPPQDLLLPPELVVRASSGEGISA